MKFLTNQKVIQKIVIALILVILFSFSIPKPVQADWGGTLASPIISLVAAIADAVQHLMEWAMLGESSNFMKNWDTDLVERVEGDIPEDAATVPVEDNLDGSFIGLDAVNIPVITYTPEEIFSNRVPALDVNFIKPSVIETEVPEGGTRNIAKQIQSIIAGWYNAIRSLAIVGLLSVLVYLGIRMLMTSIAADKAKYKKMMVDWLIAMCLVLVLHYIMAFALTITETITSMLAPDLGKTIVVEFADDVKIGNGRDRTPFYTNLMGYVRLMIQAEDLNNKIAFLALYIMLVIFNIRFTWTYLKRVLTMAFLTLIAPVVALTYPIDKASDGKAQAFDMWIKEFTFNALLQPLHLFLYMVLLGSAIHLAAINPLYAVACLAFIMGAEKLLKKMFGFDKASGGTLGTLAGAAGVTAMASKALTNFASGGKGGGSGKVRTNEQYKRVGRDPNATKDFNSFAPGGNALPPTTETAGRDTRTTDQGGGNQDAGRQDNGNAGEDGSQQPFSVDEQLEQERANSHVDLPESYWQDRRQQLVDEQNARQAEQNNDANDVDASGSPDEAATAAAIRNIGPDRTFSGVVAEDMANFGRKISGGAKNIGRTIMNNNPFTEDGKKNLGKNITSGIRKRAIGAWKAAPTVAYKAARGTLKTVTRAGVAGLAGVIAATNGDGEQAIAAALGGAVAGGALFEGTAGKVMKDKSIADSYGAGVHGSKTDARNARADKEFLKSDEFNDYYEKYFKGKKTKKEVKEAYLSYRQAGITDNGTIRKAMALEDKYNTPGADPNLVRENVQNIVQTKDILDSKAYTDDRVKEKEIQRIQRSLPAGGNNRERRRTAEQIFQGYVDFRDMG